MHINVSKFQEKLQKYSRESKFNEIFKKYQNLFSSYHLHTVQAKSFKRGINDFITAMDLGFVLQGQAVNLLPTCEISENWPLCKGSDS